MKKEQNLENSTKQELTIPVVNARTELKLLRTWDAPTHFFPVGIRGSALYFANVCGMSVEKFIEDYERGLFSDWFEVL